MRYEEHEPIDSDELEDTIPSEEIVEPNFPNLPVMRVAAIEEVAVGHPTLITNPLRGGDWDFSPPSPELQLRIQEDLSLLGRYPGKQNGAWGDLSVYGIQETVGHYGPRPDYDLCVRIQEFAVELGAPEGRTMIDGILTEEIWEAFARGLEKGSK